MLVIPNRIQSNTPLVSFPPCIPIMQTYVVIKHLGTGTYGQVKLAFNLKDKKLYAIKACRKSQLGCPSLLPGLSRAGGAMGGGSRRASIMRQDL